LGVAGVAPAPAFGHRDGDRRHRPLAPQDGVAQAQFQRSPALVALDIVVAPRPAALGLEGQPVRQAVLDEDRYAGVLAPPADQRSVEVVLRRLALVLGDDLGRAPGRRPGSGRCRLDTKKSRRDRKDRDGAFRPETIDQSA
jgi:hypothetical protein